MFSTIHYPRKELVQAGLVVNQSGMGSRQIISIKSLKSRHSVEVSSLKMSLLCAEMSGDDQFNTPEYNFCILDSSESNDIIRNQFVPMRRDTIKN